MNIKIVLSILFLSLLCSCYGGKDDKLSKDHASFEIEIVDTLTIDYQGILQIIDFDAENKIYLAIDKSKKGEVILTVDENGQILQKFVNADAGDHSFKGSLSGLGFDRKGGFWLLSHHGFYRYSSDWEIGLFKPNTNESPKLLNVHYDLANFGAPDSLLFLTVYNAPEHGNKLNEAAYYRDILNFTVIDFKKGSFSNQIGFEKESQYLNSKGLFPPYLTIYSYNHDGDELTVSYSNEPRLFVYKPTDKDFRYIRNISLDLDYFRFNKEDYLGNNPDMLQATLDSRIERILTYGKFTFVSYTKGLDRNEIISQGIEADDRQNFQKYVLDNFRQCLHVLKDGEKIGADIILPDYFSYPVLAYSESELLMGIPRFRYEFENEVFIRIKIKSS